MGTPLSLFLIQQTGHIIHPLILEPVTLEWEKNVLVDKEENPALGFQGQKYRHSPVGLDCHMAEEWRKSRSMELPARESESPVRPQAHNAHLSAPSSRKTQPAWEFIQNAKPATGIPDINSPGQFLGPSTLWTRRPLFWKNLLALANTYTHTKTQLLGK